MNKEIGLFTTDDHEIPLSDVSVDVNLQDLVSEVTIEQTYKNDEEVNIEAVYTFPLPIDAVLLELSMEIGGRKLSGEITSKRKSEEIYEEAITDGNTALLLQKKSDGLYTINIGNLQPDEEVSIRFRYAEMHRWQGNQMRFMLPTVIAERYGSPGATLASHEVPETDGFVEHPYKLSILVSGVLQVCRIESPSHAVQMIRDDRGLLIKPSTEDLYLDRDFILNFFLISDQRVTSSAICASDPYDDKAKVTLVNLTPSIPDHLRETSHGMSLKVLVDCSGSMTGDSINQAKIALLKILEKLTPEDEFNLIMFGSTHQTFKKQMCAANEKNLLSAKRFIRRIDADLGGTEIGNALDATYALQGGLGTSSDILLITDGEVWDTDGIYEKAAVSGHRIFTVGVGSAVSEEFVRNIADRSSGACELVSPNEEMADRIVRHFERMRAAEASVTIDWGNKTTQIPASINRVFDGDTSYVFGATYDEVSESIDVQYKMENGEVFHNEITIRPSSLSADLIARLAAAQRIVHLDDIDRATDYAVQYQLLTEHTGMTAVDVRTEDEQADDLPELRKVPQMRAAGWGGYGRVKPAIVECSEPMMRVESVSYSYSRPTFQRQSPPMDSSDSFSPALKGLLDPEYLDIPAFLRCSADEGNYERTPLEFVIELDKRLSGMKKWFTTIDLALLIECGLPDDMIDWLEEIVESGLEERIVVLEFIRRLTSARSIFLHGRQLRRVAEKALKSEAVGNSAISLVQFTTDATETEWPTYTPR